MAKFPVDVPIERVVKALEHIGFRLVREGNHIRDGAREYGWNPNAPDHTEPSKD